jgi:hypothetical protein
VPRCKGRSQTAIESLQVDRDSGDERVGCRLHLQITNRTRSGEHKFKLLGLTVTGRRAGKNFALIFSERLHFLTEVRTRGGRRKPAAESPGADT